MRTDVIEIGNLTPVRRLAEEIAEWERQVGARPLPDSDPVVQAIAKMRESLADVLSEAQSIEMELSAAQYAQLRGLNLQTLYKRWQRGRLPEAQMRGGKLVFPLSALTGTGDAAA